MVSDEFEKYLYGKNCFKLICGAGNRDFEAIKRLCAVYAAAGCKFFDVNASKEAVRAAKEGISLAPEKEKRFICISVGTKTDSHMSKYKITPEKCGLCGACEKVCPQSAINKGNIDENKCTGCGKCQKICNSKAIIKYFEEMALSKLLPGIISEGIDCIEYHCETKNEKEAESGFKELISLYKGAISVSINRSKTGNEKLLRRLEKMKKLAPGLFMIQADGAPMSGGKDDFRTTLQAVATAEIIEKAGISEHIFISGGTNTKTSELAKLCCINYTGIAQGTFARLHVKEFTDNDKLLTDKTLFAKAVKKAGELL